MFQSLAGDPQSPRGLSFSPATMLAPMEGVTSPVLRHAIAKISGRGLGMMCTEFIRVSNEPVRPRQLVEHVIKSPGLPLSVQLMGREPAWMARASGILGEAGADVIDINLGCPTKRAVKGGVGAAMLKDMNLLFEVLSSMRASVKGLLSAKIRAGFDQPDKVLEIVSTVERAGVDFLVIHPRLRRDQYRGTADWRIVKRVKQETSLPVIGNGDCWYADDALNLMAETGCDGIMIGRPALRNPWIFSQLQALREGKPFCCPSPEEIMAFWWEVRRGYEAENFRGGVLTGRLKELWGYMSRISTHLAENRKLLLRTQDPETFFEHLEPLIFSVPSDDWDWGQKPAALRGEKNPMVSFRSMEESEEFLSVQS